MTQSQTVSPNLSNSFLPSLTQPFSILIIVVVIILVILSNDKNSQQILASGAWGGQEQKNKAKKKGIQQINNIQRNSTCLYINQPSFIREQLLKSFALRKINIPLIKRGTKPTLYLPDMQRGLLCIGAAGSGKTFSAIDPLIRSALDQCGVNLGLAKPSVVVYDFKYPTQTSRIVGYALKRGLKVKIFAPGFPESETINLLDFLTDSEDGTTAGQLATTLVRNTDITQGKGNQSGYFEDAGIMLTQGIFQISKAIGHEKGSQYADLMTAMSVLSLPKLGENLKKLKDKGKFSPWVWSSLEQLISVSGAPQTEAGIVSTAMKIFQKFMKKDYIPAFAGQSTLDVNLSGGELIIIGVDQNNRDMISGLLASFLDVLLFSNVTRSARTSPLYCFLDELPTIFLPRLANLLAEYREAGFCGILAAQTIAQMKNTYGDETAKVILANVGTKIIFNPQEAESAKYSSDLLGEKEVRYSAKSKSRGKNSNSRSDSEHIQKGHLFSPEEFMRLPTGKGILVSPAYERGKESYIPLLEEIKVSPQDVSEQKDSENSWPLIRETLIKKRQKKGYFEDSFWNEQFQERQRLVNELFEIEDTTKADSTNPNSSDNNQEKIVKTSQPPPSDFDDLFDNPQD